MYLSNITNNYTLYTRHTGQSYINKGFILMFFQSMISTSATDLSGHLGRLLDRNLVTALHWDLSTVLFWNLLTVLNRFLNWDLRRGKMLIKKYLDQMVT